MGSKATTVAKVVTMASKPHNKARCSIYPRTKDVERLPVQDDKVSWSVPFPEYVPTDYTSESIRKQPVYADPDITTVTPAEPLKFNQLDGRINRISHFCTYQLVDGIPINPKGRTGLKGRGALGRWGPNHAADPIVTRWKRDDNDKKILGKDGKPILQFVSVQRKDNHQWAIPGGMVDAGEVITATLRREFGEEALNSLEMTDAQRNRIEKKLEVLFNSGEEIYRGYVDDPRNTDNAWMETVALNFHDEDGTSLGQIDLCAGDDAMSVRWTDLSSELDLYASHIDFIAEVAKRRNASW